MTDNNDRNRYVPDQNEKEYWDWWQDTNSTNEWAIQRSNTILHWVKKFADDKKINILDSGCGNGWFAVKLSDFGNVTGVDLSEAHMREAAEKFPHIQFYGGDFISFDLPTAHYDLIVSQQVIAHVHDQKQYIERIHELLAPNGHLILTTNNQYVLQRTPGYQSHEDKGHRENWLSKQELRELLDPGFDLIFYQTIIPTGNQGILRLLNSHKLNSFLNVFFSEKTINECKERMGLGYIQFVVARKK